MNRRQRNVGLVIWATMSIGLVVVSLRGGNATESSPRYIAAGVSEWVLDASQDYYATGSTHSLLFPGDPVFLKKDDGTFRQVGFVIDHFGERGRENWTYDAVVKIYDQSLSGEFAGGFALESHVASTSLDQVFQTLVNQEKQEQIAKIISKDWEKHRDEFVAKLTPVIQTSLSRAASSIEAKLPSVLESRRPEFARLADRYQTTIVRDQIVPLVREEILPIVQDEVRPVARDLGKQLWERVSLWSFTWRYLYDVSPLPEKNALKSEFNRFLNDEVTPAIEARMDEFVAMTERIVSRVSRNEKVRAVVRDSLKRVASDPELQQIVWQVIQESVLQNAELQSNLTTYWESAEVRDMLNLAAARFEPTARAVADAVIGARSEGITPEFASVLRNQILMKDRRWLVIVPKPESLAEPKGLHAVQHSTLPILRLVPATTSMPFPLEFEGTSQSPLTPVAPPR